MCPCIGKVPKSARILFEKNINFQIDSYRDRTMQKNWRGLGKCTSVSYIAFIAFVANNCEIFWKTFQSMKTRIHIVYHEMSKLLTSLISIFVKSKVLRDAKSTTVS